MNPKIISYLYGGLGNQLFIYAASRRLALFNNAELVLDCLSGFASDKKYQRHFQLDHFNINCRKATANERLEPFSKIRHLLKSKWNRRLPFSERKYLVQEGIDFDPRLLHYKVKSNIYLKGYWQSEKYFNDSLSTICRELQIIPPTDDKNIAMAEQIRNCRAVAVHVRFFDAPNSNFNTLPLGDYYSRALAEIKRRFTDAHFFLFSDQPEIVSSFISFSDSKFTLVSHNKGEEFAYADLWLMTQCQHYIIANSTFSWWGAWLGIHPDKIIITPGFEQRSENGWGFTGFLPDSWIKY